MGIGTSSGLIVAGSNGAGNANRTEESLLSQHPEFQYWNNVVSVGNGTGIYLGKGAGDDTGYVLTAKHVMVPSSGSISVSGTSYSIVDNNSIGTADLRVYEISGETMPNLPRVSFATADPVYNESLIMLGHGSRVQGTANDPNVSDLVNVSGYDVYQWGSPGTLSWGENQAVPFFGSGDPVMAYTNSLGNYEEDFFASFDDPGTGNYTSSWEAMASGGDSGGPVFAYRDGQYELAGVISTVLKRGGQPNQTAAFGNKTAIVNIAEYSASLPELEDAVAAPEPGSSLLVILGLMQCAMVRRRART
ncbi:MAG: hypothetical protein ACSHYF_06285 [Verrucomicrobiaceae bacterium]